MPFFHYIADEMSIVPFSDFLKRYIYEKLKMDTPFAEVGDSVYYEIIENAFSDNDAPYSLTETKSKKSTIINRWLTQKSIKRESVFILGFGLKMSAEDVGIFLTKVIAEEDFDFSIRRKRSFGSAIKRIFPIPNI